MHYIKVSKSGSIWLALACLLNCLSPSWQSGGEGLHCFTANHSLFLSREEEWQGQAKQRRWPHRPDPPVVTSNAGIPEIRGRWKQGWALSKRGSQCLGVGGSWNRGETEEVLCQDCDTEYQRSSTEEGEREGGGIGGKWVGRERGGKRRLKSSGKQSKAKETGLSLGIYTPCDR